MPEKDIKIMIAQVGLTKKSGHEKRFLSNLTILKSVKKEVEKNDSVTTVDDSEAGEKQSQEKKGKCNLQLLGLLGYLQFKKSQPLLTYKNDSSRHSELWMLSFVGNDYIMDGLYAAYFCTMALKRPNLLPQVWEICLESWYMLPKLDGLFP